jgi:peptide/nickel transport system permease protein
MLLLLLRRVLSGILLFVALITVVFFITRLTPGDPVDPYLDPDMGAEQRELLKIQLGLDKSLFNQYLDWIGDIVLRGDLGRSLRLHRPVTQILGETIPNTLLLTVPAYILHLICAMLLGVWMAQRRGTAAERGATILGLSVYSLPTFWLGLMMILVFSRWLGWFPAGGMSSPDAFSMNAGERLLDTLHHMVLPVLLLGVSTTVGTARYLRRGLVEALTSDYALAARARGLPPRTVTWNHAVRNALLPVVTLVGLNLPFLLGGAVVTEYVFAWPGMGRVAIDAIFTRDYPVILGATILAALMVIVSNLLADLVYGLVDPRIRLRDGGGA